MFSVGQLVECVDAEPNSEVRYGKVAPHGTGNMGGLAAGHVYHVRWAGVYKRRADGYEYVGVRVEGIRRGNHEYLDTPFNALRFRPLTDTRIAVFRALLSPTPTKERVEA